MDKISISLNNTANLSPLTSGSKKTDSVGLPEDSFRKSESAEEFKSNGGNLLTAFLDIRVPTTTKPFPDEDREKILSSIKPGDVILETNDAFPNWQILEKAAFNSDFTHAAIYEGDGKFIEATTGDGEKGGVIRTDLRDYLEGRIKVEIVRPPYKEDKDIKAALDYARSQLGKPYDSGFDTNDDQSHYCAELVQRALESCPNKIEVPRINLLGKEYVGPNSFQKIPGTEVVYSTGSNFWKSMMARYPVFAAAAASAVIGGMTLGPLGAVAGFAAGGTLATMTGNKIQGAGFGLIPKG